MPAGQNALVLADDDLPAIAMQIDDDPPGLPDPDPDEDASSETGPCAFDLDGDNAVGFSDLLQVLTFWGPCQPGCAADVSGNGVVGFEDILLVIQEWGPC